MGHSSADTADPTIAVGEEAHSSATRGIDAITLQKQIPEVISFVASERYSSHAIGTWQAKLDEWLVGHSHFSLNKLIVRYT